MDIDRVAAMLAQCNSDDEVAGVLDGLYTMVPAEQQDSFRWAMNIVKDKIRADRASDTTG